MLFIENFVNLVKNLFYAHILIYFVHIIILSINEISYDKSKYNKPGFDHQSQLFKNKDFNTGIYCSHGQYSIGIYACLHVRNLNITHEPKSSDISPDGLSAFYGD